jgi:membrane dipeptidase
MTENRSSLIIRALVMYLFSLLFVVLLIFLPAGSLKFWNGWLFISVLFTAMIFVLAFLLVKDPDLLAKRLKTKEKEKPQKAYVTLSIIVLFFTFIIPGLDYRFHWSDVSVPVVLISTVIMMAGYVIFFAVMRQNAYASRVIEIQEGQKLIDTGLYSVVRHPMYLGGSILYLSAPLVLGSWYALIPAALIPILLIIRIMNEEKVLVNGLEGYPEYMKKVRYRFIPFVWFVSIPLIVLLPSCKNKQMERSDKALRETALKICQDNLILDSHIDWPYWIMENPEDISGQTLKGDFDLVRARKGGLNAAFTVAYINSALDVNSGRKMVDSVLNLKNFYLNKYSDKFAPARNPDDVIKNFEKNLLSLPVSLENGSPIGDDLGYLKYLKDQGIVYITLCHDRTNQISDSNFDQERRWNGLSPFGLEVIKEMNRLGIMIDISHSTDSTVFQALRNSQAPVVATHSSCRNFAPGLERNLPDTLIEAIADKKGVVMVNFGSYFLEPESMENWIYLFYKWPDSTGIDLFSKEGLAFMNEYGKSHKLHSDASHVADHIDHIVKLAGIDFVGIGSDFDGIDYAQPTDLPDVSTYPVLVFELLRRGYTEKDIKKILSENFLRVWNDVLKVADDVN